MCLLSPSHQPPAPITDEFIKLIIKVSLNFGEKSLRDGNFDLRIEENENVVGSPQRDDNIRPQPHINVMPAAAAPVRLLYNLIKVITDRHRNG